MLKSKIKALLLSSRHKKITRPYPFVPLTPPENLRGRLKVDPNKCIGCGNCVRTCPSRLIEIQDKEDEKIVLFYSGRCIYCGRCATACPEKAIRITHEFELATDNKQDLDIVIKIKMVKCSICGKPFITLNMLNKQIERLQNKTEEQINKLKICSECRRKNQNKEA
ncbi:MAG: 4Fe-4S binding protein [Thermodesulfovibrio sp.]|uniref:4Fe-4S dicluster domain-containing protein n=1 Tax=unclassified Thermodesulfovibrio TaxID=2645936 RepID=UPI00083B3C38|nr:MULTISPECIES: 4Fe-4S dicluster domain-containing protein [unclassified Thermodesulfovibrio]MDI1472559.1 4Fe-4S binding protein [Thermodesulfovibrio sp. 1176]MDI6714397.1 4Fe-4S binding protein [Thermodesulfovibrio sp.]ODA44895.1 Ni,Fe-hydrogenase, medium iron-sulfur subunit [Thermodesulfovibrio sp. N1]